MAINVAFLLKDVVLLAVSIYLLREDVGRVVAARLVSEGENRVLQPTRAEVLALRGGSPKDGHIYSAHP